VVIVAMVAIASVAEFAGGRDFQRGLHLGRVAMGHHVTGVGRRMRRGPAPLQGLENQQEDEKQAAHGANRNVIRTGVLPEGL